MKASAQSIELPVSDELLLRTVSREDAQPIFNLIDANRDFLRKWLPFVDYSKSAADTEAFIRSVTSDSNTTDLVFAILYQGKHAGVIGFKGIDMANQRLEIGYWLAQNQQDKGIMIQCCKAVLAFAFEQMQMNRIQIKVAVKNTRSGKIPKKLNFTFEGVQRDGERQSNGQFHDLEVYSLLQREWKQGTED